MFLGSVNTESRNISSQNCSINVDPLLLRILISILQNCATVFGAGYLIFGLKRIDLGEPAPTKTVAIFFRNGIN
jgi:hypothetical protein